MRRWQREQTERGKALKSFLGLVPEIGREYTVQGYWTGTFRGRLVWISDAGWIFRFVVTDAMREQPIDACPFPECTAESDHDGEHVFDETLRNGRELEVYSQFVKLRASVFDQFQKKASSSPDEYTREEFERDRFGESGGNK